VRPARTIKGLSILVVDDNATNRLILMKQLAAWGAHAEETKSGAEALERLRVAAGEPFGLVLMDLHMPEMDGVETAQRIKAESLLADAPLVLLSSVGAPEIAAAARAAGFAAALNKPVRQSTLFNTIIEVLGRPAAETQERRGRAAPVSRDPRLGLRVLVAEDNVVNRKVAVRMLMRWGCHVDAVTNGREALELLAALPYDLVLMDVQMPEMDGLEATAEIRRREAGTDRCIPVIAMTAHAMQGDRERFLAAGMDDYVAKPVKPEDLLRTLSRWGGRVCTEVPASPRGVESLRLDRLQESCGNDPALEREVLGDFLTLAPELLSRLTTSVATGNDRELASAAHALKGSSRTIGADALAAVCEELETLGREGALDAARDALERARRQFAGLQAALRFYLPGRNPSSEED
jgi:CheY-like chemotaxis protein/HPt (histidine-containing phosphotransfer) domain-containing protein